MFDDCQAGYDYAKNHAMFQMLPESDLNILRDCYIKLSNNGDDVAKGMALAVTDIIAERGKNASNK